MNNQKIQQSELAGKTKLTAVTIRHGRHRLQFFSMVEHDSRGKAVLSQDMMNQALDRLGVRRGDTFTSG
jgi:hypothetical protein